MKNILGKHLNLPVAVPLKSPKGISPTFCLFKSISGRFIDQWLGSPYEYQRGY